jgi:uncharacterized membrane protein
MFELLTLISIVLAISALSSAKGLRSRLETEIAALKLEIKRLETMLKPRPEGTAPVLSGSDDEVVAQAVEASPAIADEAEAIAAPALAPEDMAENAETAIPSGLAAEAEAMTAEPTAAKAPKESFESMLAARWSVWVGGIALAFAGIFAVKYSIDQGLLSPAVRLSLAAVFGLVLMAVGELARRRTRPLVSNQFQNAMIPGIVTAAGVLTLMGAVYVAHGIYDYFGPAVAFGLLGLISFATLALSLLHGQGLAVLGLLASFATPLLVTSDDPKPWPLFGFLTIAWIASNIASRLRGWRVAPALANAGLAIWSLLYLAVTAPFEPAPLSLALLIMVAGLAFIWPGMLTSAETERPAGHTPWQGVLLPPHLASTLIAALGIMLVGVVLVAPDHESTGGVEWTFGALVVGLALFGALRSHALYPAVFAALTAIGGIRIMSLGSIATGFGSTDPGGFQAFTDPPMVTGLALGLGMVFAALAVAANWRHRFSSPQYAIAWSAIGAVAPLVLGSLSFLFFGNYEIDLKHGAFGLALAILYLGGAIGLYRQSDFDGRYQAARDIFLAASWAALVFVLMVTTNGIATTLGVAILGFAYLNATRLKDWPSLPWGMAASAIFVAGRIAWDPTIVGPEHLGRTPVFNALLAGYGIPALLLIASAWLVRNRADDRLRNVLEALASLFSLLTLAILVRHAMNGGVLNSSLPTLGEQAIYTLLAVGASATLMALDLRRPSIIFRTGSMAVGYISMASVLIAHYGALNPYVTGELTGSIPVFNLLFLAYLLPGLAYGATALFARGRRPQHYVIALALTAASLLFAYVTLSVRRIFHGESIADWKGFLQSELYTYSVVWLLLGVALLVLGYRLRSKSIRIASAVLVLIAVLKVFLVDMSNLEGLFRVLSFIGLGVALIGIGRFYQTILTGLAGDADPPKETPAETAPRPAGEG